jgi:hypothetical protein
MLGGLQFNGSFSTNPEKNEGCLAAFKTCTPENALLSVLTAYFSGTAAGGLFPHGGTNTITVGSETVFNAPLNWLQIYETDIRYALGWGNTKNDCYWAMFQSNPPKNGGPPKGCKPADMSKHTASTVGQTAQQLLTLASGFIRDFTAEPVALPPTCCPAGYPVPRNAFVGDPVCVTIDEEKTVASDNAATASNYFPGLNYTKVPTVPYGVCFYYTFPHSTPIYTQYRQAYMGDYVCVPPGDATQIQNQNATISSRVQTACPFVPSLPGPPFPGLR